VEHSKAILLAHCVCLRKDIDISTNFMNGSTRQKLSLKEEFMSAISLFPERL